MVDICLGIIFFCLTIICVAILGALVIFVFSLIKEWWEDR